jgi:parvulin-like peptidyl-prolyl isomerase
MVWRVLIILGWVFAPALAVAEVSEPLVAKVNGTGIPRVELDNNVEAYRKRQGLSLGAIGGPRQYRELKQKVLDVLIDQELLWQEAGRKKLLVSDAEVKKALKTMRDSQPSEEAYLGKLETAGFNEESFSQDLKRRMSVIRLIKEDVARDIKVSDEEIHTFYMARPERFKQPEEIHLRHVLVKLEAKGDEKAEQAAKAKIESVLAEAKADADFAELARKHSEGPSASMGGDLGFISKGQTTPPFEQAAFDLEPGEISGVVKTSYGFHIIKVEERRGGDDITEKAAAEGIRNLLTSQKTNEAIKQRVKSLRAQGDVEILVVF